MTKTALIIGANGTEEMELVITTDVLRRAEVDVTVAGLNGPDALLCSRKVRVVPDAALSEVKDRSYDVIILPGGLDGTHALADSPMVKEILTRQQERGGMIAAICAAPYALAKNGICTGRKVTSHPSKKADMKDYQYLEDRVVIDGNLITSRGPGTAFEFGIAIAETLLGKKLPDLGPAMFVKN